MKHLQPDEPGPLGLGAVILACPWCQEPIHLAKAEFSRAPGLHCAGCGTVVDFDVAVMPARQAAGGLPAAA